MAKDILSFIQSVINKKFDSKNKGYDPDQVDETLDAIFEQFKAYIYDANEKAKKLLNIEEDNKSLMSELEALKKENNLLQSHINKLESSGVSMDLINKRLNNMEMRIDSSGKKATTKINNLTKTTSTNLQHNSSSTKKINATKKVSATKSVNVTKKVNNN